MASRSEAPNRKVTKFLNGYAEGDQVVLFYRAPDGKVRHMIERVDATCFIKAEHMTPAILRELRHSSSVRGVKQEGDYYRVQWVDRDTLKRVTRKDALFDKRGIPTFEADLDPVRRWLTDHPEATIDKPRRCYLDIESDSRVPFAKKAEARTLAWSVQDHETGERTTAVLAEDTDLAERDLLIELWRTLARYDQICAWNGDRFDFPQIENRSLKQGIPVDVRRWLWLDHLVLFRRMNMSASESGEEKQSFALGAVAKAVVGRGKLEFDEDELSELELAADDVVAANTWQIWTKSPEAIRRYVEDDVDLMREIELETGYIDLHYTVCEACFVFPDTVGIQPTKQVEGFLMRLAAPRGMRFRTHYYQENSSQFKGAFVMDPVEGYHDEEIHVADFAGMYPSIIMSWNMSVETFRDDIVLRESAAFRPSYYSHLPLQEFPIPDGFCAAPITDVCFANEPAGILPTALTEILRLRAYWNEVKAKLPPGTTEAREAERKAAAYKICANSFYGVVGSPFSRFFERPVAESVSQAGRWLIERIIEAVAPEVLGPKERAKEPIYYEPATRAGTWKVIYGDTDSIFVIGCSRDDFAAFVKWCNVELFPKLLATKKTTRNFIKLAYEKAFRRTLFLSKKRYAALWAHYKGTEATSESKPEIKGLEFKRGDAVKLARELQRDVIYKLLGYKCEVSKDPADFEAIVLAYRDRVLVQKLELSEIVTTKKLTKPINEYARKEKKVPAKLEKLYGDDVVITFTDFECAECGAGPMGELSIRAGKCGFCGGAYRKRKSFARGWVTNVKGDTLGVSDGKKSAIVWKCTISQMLVYSSLAEHVRVARELASRGRDVGQGVRIEYIVLDEKDPFGVIPAEDFTGELDRPHLWRKIFEPTARVLAQAFPGHAWSWTPVAAPNPNTGIREAPVASRMTARQALAAGLIGPGAKKAPEDAPAPVKRGKKVPSSQGSLF